jgi:ABC-type Fe3+/spermidine/putrescine transport system ATPase subunit
MRLELKALQDRLGFTAIYVTHDQAEALGLAQALVLMSAGRIEMSGPARQVFAGIRSPFAARFFGLNVIEGRVSSVDAAGGRINVRCGEQTVAARAPDWPVAVGETVALGVHREHVGLRPAGAAPALGALTGILRTSSFQGLHEEHLIELAGGVAIRSLQPVLGLDRDSAVDVLIDPAHLTVLRTDPQSQ